MPLLLPRGQRERLLLERVKSTRMKYIIGSIFPADPLIPCGCVRIRMNDIMQWTGCVGVLCTSSVIDFVSPYRNPRSINWTCTDLSRRGETAYSSGRGIRYPSSTWAEQCTTGIPSIPLINRWIPSEESSSYAWNSSSPLSHTPVGLGNKLHLPPFVPYLGWQW